MAASPAGSTPSRRSRLARHGLPVLALAVLAFAGGALAGAGHVPAERRVAERFLSAWERGDHAAMHRLLTADAQRAAPLEAFRAAYEDAGLTATATGMRIGRPQVDDGLARASVTVATRVWGPVQGAVVLPLQEVDGESRIAWRGHLVFPGLRPGERLERQTGLPERAALRARDGTTLAEGPNRTSELGLAAATVVGELGAIPEARARRLRAMGWPSEAQVGVTGLERAFDERLAGRPGGELLASSGRVLASAEARPADPLRTSVSVGVQQAVVEALAGRLGGIVALRPDTGEILGAGGIGLTGLQPPGSVFKIVTLAAALEEGITSTDESYEVRTAAVLEGVELQNANGEPCGGTLAQAFARSCNSVFAPMGAELGARRLVEAAEAFGFNGEPAVPGATASTIPPAGEVGDDLAVGATAIGQGRVQSTALQMAVVAATIAREGVRPEPTFRRGGEQEGDAPQRAVPAEVARTVGRLMERVVAGGTGAAAALPGVTVAGKTGTAELRTTQGDCEPQAEDPAACPPQDDPTDTTAWFVAYAPGDEPEVAVAVMLVGAGSGGATAAPAARIVLQAAVDGQPESG